MQTGSPCIAVGWLGARTRRQTRKRAAYSWSVVPKQMLTGLQAYPGTVPTVDPRPTRRYELPWLRTREGAKLHIDQAELAGHLPNLG